MPPKTSAEFDHAYRAPLTPWGDIRIPAELRALLRSAAPRAVLELGSGLGRFSRYVAGLGIAATGVDFSPVAVEKARARVATSAQRPTFIVGDVTDLRELDGPFDAAFDIGCFHCLDAEGQARYAAAIARLLPRGATHLIWAMDDSPGGSPLSPEPVASTFSPYFRLVRAEPSRRRFARSHWYWLTRDASSLRAA